MFKWMNAVFKMLTTKWRYSYFETKKSNLLQETQSIFFCNVH